MGLNPMTDSLGKDHADEKGKDWNDKSVSQETPRIAGNHMRLGERLGIDSPSEIL